MNKKQMDKKYIEAQYKNKENTFFEGYLLGKGIMTTNMSDQEFKAAIEKAKNEINNKLSKVELKTTKKEFIRIEATDYRNEKILMIAQYFDDQMSAAEYVAKKFPTYEITSIKNGRTKLVMEEGKNVK